MRKPIPKPIIIRVITVTVIGILLIGIGLGIYSCVRSPRRVIALAVGTDGKPELEYSGSGIYNYQRDVGRFALQIDVVPGIHVIQVVGQFRQGPSNSVSLFVRSSALEPYTIRLMGFSSDAGTKVEVEQASEMLEMPQGTCGTNFERFLVYMHKFE